MLLKPEKHRLEKKSPASRKEPWKKYGFGVGAVTRILRLPEIEKSDFLDA